MLITYLLIRTTLASAQRSPPPPTPSPPKSLSKSEGRRSGTSRVSEQRRGSSRLSLHLLCSPNLERSVTEMGVSLNYLQTQHKLPSPPPWEKQLPPLSQRPPQSWSKIFDRGGRLAWQEGWGPGDPKQTPKGAALALPCHSPFHSVFWARKAESCRYHFKLGGQEGNQPPCFPSLLIHPQLLTAPLPTPVSPTALVTYFKAETRQIKMSEL